MQIAVTGSSGKIGRAAVKTLTQAGHDVVGLDTQPSPDGAPTLQVDLADFGEVFGALSGAGSGVAPQPDAVVHLAGVPGPGRAPDHTTYAVNTLGTYHVFSASARLGIERVVWASSETLLGLPFDEPPAFLPLDETAPVRPEFDYALSKQSGETLADEFVRWNDAMTIVSLRFSNVYAPEDRRNLADAQASTDARRPNLWGYVDAEDAGRACRDAVLAPLRGHHRLIIAAADTISDTPTRDLIAAHFPDVEIREPLTGNTSLLSSAHAEKLIGYRPQISWRDWPT
jgi:nucleoside-diphosphate-sugar epimerase